MRDDTDELRSTRRALQRSLIFLAVVTLVTAWFGETFFHPDEHYQILEFLGYKLGRTAGSDLPWEFHHGIRPWMQPFLYYLLARPLTLAGLDDPFVLVRILRIVTGAGSMIALAGLAFAAVRSFATADERRVYAKSLMFYGFLPYLFVRTSSEALSAALFTGGFALLLNDARSAGHQRLLTAGLLIGTAVECRYQVALMAIGLYLWLAIVARIGWHRLAWLAIGSIVPVVAALPIDRWGYGRWCFPPWAYFQENILNGTAARDYGSDPAYGYFYMLPANIFALIALVLIVAAVVAWVRRPGHVVTWTTLPFFAVQSLIAHKEERFMFPMLLIATMLPILAFAPSAGRQLPGIDRIWGWRRSPGAKIVAGLTVAMMAFIAIYPLGYRPEIPMARYIYRHYPRGFDAWKVEPMKFVSYPIYRPHPFAIRTFPGTAALVAALDRGPVLLISGSPRLRVGLVPVGTHVERLYSELPFADVAAVADTAIRFRRNYEIGRAGALKFLPPFGWLTLYRVTRDGIMAAPRAPSPAGKPPAPLPSPGGRPA